MESFAVFIGGGFGALSRYLLSKCINNYVCITFPIATFIVNMIGCLVIGFLFSIFEKKLVPSELKLLLITGFLGGFTTFSSFSLETINLMKNNDMVSAVLNIVASTILGLLCVVFGMVLSNIIFLKK